MANAWYCDWDWNLVLPKAYLIKQEHMEAEFFLDHI